MADRSPAKRGKLERLRSDDPERHGRNFAFIKKLRRCQSELFSRHSVAPGDHVEQYRLSREEDRSPFPCRFGYIGTAITAPFSPKRGRRLGEQQDLQE